MQTVLEQKIQAIRPSRGRFSHWLNGLTAVLLFSYPSLLVLQKDVHMAFLVFLGGLGLFCAGTGWRVISNETKTVIFFVALFLGVSGLSLLNVEDWRHCLWLLSRYEPFVLLPFLIFLFSTRKNVMQSFFYGMILSGFVCFGIAAYEVWSLSLERAEGAFKNANRFGSVAVCFASFLVAAWFFLPMKRYLMLSAGFSAFFCLWAGLLSGSRGAVFVFPILMLFLWYVLFFMRKLKNEGIAERLPGIRAYRWSLVIFLLAFTVGFTGYNGFLRQHAKKAVTEVEEYLHGKRDNEASIGQRLMMWGYAVQIWKRHPWIGTGIGDVEKDMTELNQAAGSPMTHIYYDVHNIYLNVLASTGIVGLTGMVLACFVAPFRAFRRSFLNAASHENARYAAVCGVMTLIFFAMNGISEGWIYTRGVTFFVLLLAVFLSGVQNRNED
ncbi:MAG: O-antigen ligase family protein [Dissulfuribacterales bacterium]